MDPHIILSVVLTGLLGALGWFVRSLVARITKLEQDLNDHKVQDASQFATLNANTDDTKRRLMSIEEKLDQLLQQRHP